MPRFLAEALMQKPKVVVLNGKDDIYNLLDDFVDSFDLISESKKRIFDHDLWSWISSYEYVIRDQDFNLYIACCIAKDHQEPFEQEGFQAVFVEAEEFVSVSKGYREK